MQRREEGRLLGPPLIALRHQLSDQTRIVRDDARLAPDLHTLPGAESIRKANALGFWARLPWVTYWRLPVKSAKPIVLSSSTLRKPGGAATVLNVGLAPVVRRAQEDADLAFDELGEIGRDTGLP
jgi:hypothetical protein